MPDAATVTEPAIAGVRLIPLKVLPDDRGWLFEILRADQPHFQKFGQVYLSACYPGVIKAWHAHRTQTDHQCVVDGRALIGLFDDREGSPTRGRTMAVDARGETPMLVQVPPGVWHGVMAIGERRCLLINIPTEVYDPKSPDELRREPDDPAIPFNWSVGSD